MAQEEEFPACGDDGDYQMRDLTYSEAAAAVDAIDAADVAAKMSSTVVVAVAVVAIVAAEVDFFSVFPWFSPS